MERVDLSKYDDVKHQKDVLEYVLKNDIHASQKVDNQVSVKNARHGSSQYQAVSSRTTTRLLFISQDTTLLNQTQQTLDGYLDLSLVFDEVHIVILQEGIKNKNPVLRVAPNVWLYVASARHWWLVPGVAIQLIKEQLFFTDGFRPDLIVARDAYESALVARIIGKHYQRPTQLHVLEDFTTPSFLIRNPHAKWRLRLAHYLTKRFLSIRTSTNQIQKIIERLYPHVPDVATLPRFNNYQSITDTKVSGLTLKDKYPRFVFIMVYFGALTHNSTAYQVIDAARFILRSPHIGLIIVGDGPARSEFEKRTEILGIKEQVVFERNVDDVTSYFKTADTVIVSDDDSVGDDVVIRATAAGTPVIASKTSLRSDLFVDGESALLYDSGDNEGLSKKISQLLNDFMLRKQLAATALHVVENRLHEDPEVYRLAYRDSVEQGLFAGEAGDSITGSVSLSVANKEAIRP